MDGHGETSIPPYNFVARGIISDLTQTHLCTCLKAGHGFPPIHVMVFFFILEKQNVF
jgi:hypothetical protein